MTSPRSPLFDDPARYRVTLDAFAPMLLVQVVAFHAALTGIAALLAGWLPDLVPPHGGQFGPVWVALLPQLPLLVLTGRALAARRRQAFGFLHSLVSVANFAWLGLLGWEAPGLMAAVLISLFAMWAYHDAWIAGDRAFRLVYLAAAPAADLALLVIDATGGRGLVWAWANERSFVLTFFMLQLALTGLVQWMMVRVETEVGERDRRAREQADLERELAVMRRERETVQASATLLSTGLLASKVSHDLANPATVLRLNIDALAPLSARLPTPAERAEFDEMLADLRDAAREIVELSAGVARAVREREELAAVPLVDLVEDARAGMKSALRGHQRSAPELSVRVGELAAVACPGHAGTLANLLTNCALHVGDRPITLEARVVDEWFVVLRVRDRGVDGAEREAALARILRLLTLGADAAVESRGAGYRGLGVALVLAKLYLLRYNGALDVRAAAEGPGLQFELVLPRVHPDEIPPERNNPEAALRGGG